MGKTQKETEVVGKKVALMERERQQQEWLSIIESANERLAAKRLEIESSYSKPIDANIRDTEAVAKFVSDKFRNVQVLVSFSNGNRSMMVRPTPYVLDHKSHMHHLDAFADSAKAYLDQPEKLDKIWPSFEELAKEVSLYAAGYRAGLDAGRRSGMMEMGPFGMMMPPWFERRY